MRNDELRDCAALLFIHHSSIIPSGCNFGLKTQDIPILHPNIPQTLIVQELLAAGTVVEFIAEDLSIGRVLGEIHFFQQHRQNAIDRRIIGHVHLLAFVAGRIPNMNAHYRHRRKAPALCKFAHLPRRNALGRK
jgi:hypothetical protein